MSNDKNFTEYTDEELDKWFEDHAEGWARRGVNPKERFEVVIAEMQRRHAKEQKRATEKTINLTNKLLDLTQWLKYLTIVLVILTIVSVLILIFK